jgi:hypothetical protein
MPFPDSTKPAGESRIPGLCGAPVTSPSLDAVLVSRSAASQLGTCFFKKTPPGDLHQAGFSL